MNKLIYLIPLLLLGACKQKTTNTAVEETRTSGTVKMIVDESFSSILADQIEVFRIDYPETKFDLIQGNENVIMPAFLKDSVRVAILSRTLTPSEEKAFVRRDVRISTSRFAIDGIALITGNDNPDSTITADEVIGMLKGVNPRSINLVFDNANSSTLRYFKDLAQIKDLPKTGIYTLNTNKDVIKYVAEHKGYIGILGVNWLLNGERDSFDFTSQVKILAVKGQKGTKSASEFFKPSQKNLISGNYPFLRNVYVHKAEVKNDLGTGFANWLVGQRGQLIVLKSGLGPSTMNSRDINIKSKN